MSNLRLVQLYPNKLTITPYKSPKVLNIDKIDKSKGIKKSKNVYKYYDNFKKEKNPFVISKATKRKIFDSINNLIFLSKKRSITMSTGKKIYNYQASFITLTLPSKQEHSDLEIKKYCLNQFLIEIRKHYKIENYVWKAELQGNGNIHFHLVIDKYIDYQALRRRWNRCINKLNYVDKYTCKMRELTLQEYFEQRKTKSKCTFAEASRAFVAGRKSNWTNPNSVDVRSISSKKDLAIYLAKYISKENKKKDKTEEQVNRELEFGRSWYRSYSLSSLKFVNKLDFVDAEQVVKYLYSVRDKVKHITGDFFEVFYFNADELDKRFKAWHQFFIFRIADICKYPFP